MTELTDEGVNGAVPVSVPPDPEAPPVARGMDGAVALLTMQQLPHNFLNEELIAGLIAAVAWARTRGARAILLRSSLRNFCAGADLDLFENARPGEAPELDIVELLRVFDRAPMPIVAAVHGVCVGGGFELALACDLILAADSAKLGCVEATLGLNPLMGGIQRLTQRAGAARAKEMALLARRYDAATLERWNVINRVVAADLLPDAALTIARELANGPTVAHASTKAIVSYAVSYGVAASDEAMGELQSPIWRSSDLKAGLISLREHGPGAARFEGR